jgi:hypothetical protein
VTVSKPAAQELRDILDGERTQPFEGSGCSDHVRRRKLRLTTAAAIILFVLLLALLIL